MGLKRMFCDSGAVYLTERKTSNRTIQFGSGACASMIPLVKFNLNRGAPKTKTLIWPIY